MRAALAPILLLLLAAPVAASAASQGPATPEERSILFWLIDTCRADRLSAYGHERETTPFLERIAREGVVFESCFSQAPWTKPSMSAILTSHYPSRTGMTRLYAVLDRGFETMPQRLQKAGWYTVGFSANPIMGSFSSYERGFDHFVESWEMVHGTTPMDFASGSAAAITTHAVQWLAQAKERPFFLYMHSLDPHEWYDPAPEYKEKFADPAREELFRLEWDALMEAHRQMVNTCTAETFAAADVEPGPFLEYARALYDADILANDSAMERLWEHLGDPEFRDRMIVIVTGDHGTEFLDHGATSLGHSLYREMIHVPLVLWAPGLLPEGLRFSEPVRSIDIYPTLLELLELEAPPGLRGESLMPWIRARRATDERTVYSHNFEEPFFTAMGLESASNGMSYSVLEWPWKLIVNVKPRLGMRMPRFELYHVDRDPTERQNVAVDHPELVERLRKRLEAHLDANPPFSSTTEQLDPSKVDPATLEALEALGYVDSDEDD